MKRRALIIYCNDTGSGPLAVPLYDNSNFLEYLTSRLGSELYPGEILSLRNPKISDVSNAVSIHMKDADYTFTLVTGHGYINRNHNDLQYLEVADGDVSILKLRRFHSISWIAANPHGKAAFFARGLILSIREQMEIHQGMLVKIFEASLCKTNPNHSLQLTSKFPQKYMKPLCQPEIFA